MEKIETDNMPPVFKMHKLYSNSFNNSFEYIQNLALIRLIERDNVLEHLINCWFLFRKKANIFETTHLRGRQRYLYVTTSNMCLWPCFTQNNLSEVESGIFRKKKEISRTGLLPICMCTTLMNTTLIHCKVPRSNHISGEDILGIAFDIETNIYLENISRWREDMIFFVQGRYCFSIENMKIKIFSPLCNFLFNI